MEEEKHMMVWKEDYMGYTKEWQRYLQLMQQRSRDFQNKGPLKIVSDWEIVNNYQLQTGKIIGVRYESPYNILVVDLVYEKEGAYFAYERILPAVERGAVVCVPQYQEKYVLLKQYRHSMRDFQYAFPRGFAEEGLSGEENAKKELEEELCAGVGKVKYLGDVIADSGICGNRVGIYLCSLNQFDLNLGYEGISDLICVSKEELKRMIQSNELSDGFSLAACSYLMSQQVARE